MNTSDTTGVQPLSDIPPMSQTRLFSKATAIPIRGSGIGLRGSHLFVLKLYSSVEDINLCNKVRCMTSWTLGTFHINLINRNTPSIVSSATKDKDSSPSGDRCMAGPRKAHVWEPLPCSCLSAHGEGGFCGNHFARFSQKG